MYTLNPEIGTTPNVGGTCWDGGEYGDVCKIDREGVYDVVINFKNDADLQLTTLYLWNNTTYPNKIKKIINFSNINIKEVNELNLSNNIDIDLSNLNSNKIKTITVNNCNLNEFKLDLSSYYNTINTINFKENKLTTLSGGTNGIRCNREKYKIFFDHGIRLGNDSVRQIHLEGNPINFI
jgi:hypothetical protein